MEEEIEEMPDNQAHNTHVKEKKLKEAPLLPYLWKKGQSGNPEGRPKGKTMKEYAKELLACQTEEQRQEFLHGLPKEVIWKMAEGNPDNKTDITSGGEAIKLTPEKLALAKEYEEKLKNSI